MLKSFDFSLESASWGSKSVPQFLKAGATTDVNLAEALVMLGSITTPQALSAGSPARFWATFRYYYACAAGRSFRIHSSWSDLDPHQLGILSDDLGVAIGTQWLFDRLGGVEDIVDGRRFALNFGLRKRRKIKKPAKMGPTKCPDFVVLDHQKRYHVLECKGTQSGMGYLKGAVKRGRQQKVAIDFQGKINGQQLVIGVSLENESSKNNSVLYVVDPVDEPIAIVSADEADNAREIVDRLGLARALNLMGLERSAFAVAWPEDYRPDGETEVFLSTYERRAFAQSVGRRSESALAELGELSLGGPNRRTLVEEARIDLTPSEIESGQVVSSIRVRRGLSATAIDSLVGGTSNLRTRIENATSSAGQGGIRFTTTGTKIRLDYRSLFFCEIEFG